ncbi:hypothetical protein K439DRAFT_1616849 [Ramaria rubella]|nr:hypothetical protein K439DRAFT_1616849 [Ramaria rubella]
MLPLLPLCTLGLMWNWNATSIHHPIESKMFSILRVSTFQIAPTSANTICMSDSSLQIQDAGSEISGATSPKSKPGVEKFDPVVHVISQRRIRDFTAYQASFLVRILCLLPWHCRDPNAPSTKPDSAAQLRNRLTTSLIKWYQVGTEYPRHTSHIIQYRHVDQEFRKNS